MAGKTAAGKSKLLQETGFQGNHSQCQASSSLAELPIPSLNTKIIHCHEKLHQSSNVEDTLQPLQPCP